MPSASSESTVTGEDDEGVMVAIQDAMQERH